MLQGDENGSKLRKGLRTANYSINFSPVEYANIWLIRLTFIGEYCCYFILDEYRYTHLFQIIGMTGLWLMQFLLVF